MEAFWKTAAVMLLAVILTTAIGKTEKDFAVVLTLAGCCGILLVAMQYLSEVTAFLWKLGADGQNSVTGTLLKITGVALLTELTSLISADAGNSSLGKAMQFLGNVVMLCLSLPLCEAFLAMIRQILGIV